MTRPATSITGTVGAGGARGVSLPRFHVAAEARGLGQACARCGVTLVDYGASVGDRVVEARPLFFPTGRIVEAFVAAEAGWRGALDLKTYDGRLEDQTVRAGLCTLAGA